MASTALEAERYSPKVEGGLRRGALVHAIFAKEFDEKAL
jgi:hypothetical protein